MPITRAATPTTENSALSALNTPKDVITSCTQASVTLNAVGKGAGYNPVCWSMTHRWNWGLSARNACCMCSTESSPSLRVSAQAPEPVASRRPKIFQGRMCIRRDDPRKGPDNASNVQPPSSFRFKAGPCLCGTGLRDDIPKCGMASAHCRFRVDRNQYVATTLSAASD
jgi:hypothetical protein